VVGCREKEHADGDRFRRWRLTAGAIVVVALVTAGCGGDAGGGGASGAAKYDSVRAVYDAIVAKGVECKEYSEDKDLGRKIASCETQSGPLSLATFTEAERAQAIETFSSQARAVRRRRCWSVRTGR
jgi:hypothetical protein